MNGERTTAVVLSAGQGKRMGGEVRKQYLPLAGKPLICHALCRFEYSEVDEIVLVTGQGETEYCRSEIVEACGFRKVSKIVEGGKERYHSVYEGLKAAAGSGYVLIHDGARPCVTARIIEDAMRGAREFGAAVIAMPVKDTIKIADEHEYAQDTPDRSRLWAIQTPQAFRYDLIWEAYTRLFESPSGQIGVTDDAMVVESMTSHRVKLMRGDYANIKVTTPEDLVLAEALLRIRSEERSPFF